MTPTEILHRTSKEWASSNCEPFPCGLAVWRYACAVTGVPARALPEHQSRRAMLELLREKGGLEEYARELMLSLGWGEIEPEEAQACDVAVADLQGMGVTCVICTGRLVMAKGDGFVLLRPAPLLAVWRLPSCLKPLPPSSLQRLD